MRRLRENLTETQVTLNGFFFFDWCLDGWGMRARLEKNFQEHDEFNQQVID